MTQKITTTCRVYPDDAARLEVIRRWLQAQDGGNDKTISDAIGYAVAFVVGAALDTNAQIAQSLVVEE